MEKRQLRSFSPDRWPTLVLAVGTVGLLVRTIGQFIQFAGPLDWRTMGPYFLGHAAFDFSTVLAFYFLLRLLVDRWVLHR